MRENPLNGTEDNVSDANLFWFVVPALLLMGAIFLIPLGYVFYFSVAIDGALTLSGFVNLLTSALFFKVFATTMEISLLSTAVSVLLGYAVAFHLSRVSPHRRVFYLAMVLLPFWTSILVKSYSFTLILGREGIVNTLLTSIFGEAARLELIYNRTGVIIGMTNYLVPFVVFPVLSNLLGQDRNLRTAAEVMGAGPLRIFLRVTLPLSLPGVMAGAIMCMVLSIGFFITPAILGGRSDIMLSNLIDLFTRETLNWNMASAIGVSLLLVTGLLVAVLSRLPGTKSSFG